MLNNLRIGAKMMGQSLGIGRKAAPMGMEATAAARRVAPTGRTASGARGASYGRPGRTGRQMVGRPGGPRGSNVGMQHRTQATQNIPIQMGATRPRTPGTSLERYRGGVPARRGGALERYRGGVPAVPNRGGVPATQNRPIAALNPGSSGRGSPVPAVPGSQNRATRTAPPRRGRGSQNGGVNAPPPKGSNTSTGDSVGGNVAANQRNGRGLMIGMGALVLGGMAANRRGDGTSSGRQSMYNY